MKSINPYIQEAKYIPNRMNEHLSRLIQIFKTQRLKQQQQKSGKQSEEKKKREKRVKGKKELTHVIQITTDFSSGIMEPGDKNVTS